MFLSVVSVVATVFDVAVGVGPGGAESAAGDHHISPSLDTWMFVFIWDSVY